MENSLVATEQYQEAVFHEFALLFGWDEQGGLSPEEEESVLFDMFCNLSEAEREEEIWDMALA